MATGYKGWNRLSRNPNGFMTNHFNLGNGLRYHHTIHTQNGSIRKAHTTFTSGPKQRLKIYHPSGNTSLRKRRRGY